MWGRVGDQPAGSGRTYRSGDLPQDPSIENRDDGVKTMTTGPGSGTRSWRAPLAAALVLLALAVTTLLGQNVPQRLTLDDAIRLAKDTIRRS